MFNKIMEKQCLKCGKTANYKEGFSKAKGRAWKGYFCSNPQCKEVEWVRDSVQKLQNTPQNTRATQDPLNIISDELGAINKRFDEWDKFFKKELGAE